jgi:hypothetical protein
MMMVIMMMTVMLLLHRNTPEELQNWKKVMSGGNKQVGNGMSMHW